MPVSYFHSLALIFIGFAVARLTRQPIEALRWMNTFIIYVALAALFFQLLAKTPFEELPIGFIFGSALHRIRSGFLPLDLFP